MYLKSGITSQLFLFCVFSLYFVLYLEIQEYIKNNPVNTIFVTMLHHSVHTFHQK